MKQAKPQQQQQQQKQPQPEPANRGVSQASAAAPAAATGGSSSSNAAPGRMPQNQQETAQSRGGAEQRSAGAAPKISTTDGQWRTQRTDVSVYEAPTGPGPRETGARSTLSPYQGPASAQSRGGAGGRGGRGGGPRTDLSAYQPPSSAPSSGSGAVGAARAGGTQRTDLSAYQPPSAAASAAPGAGKRRPGGPPSRTALSAYQPPSTSAAGAPPDGYTTRSVTFPYVCFRHSRCIVSKKLSPKLVLGGSLHCSTLVPALILALSFCCCWRCGQDWCWLNLSTIG